MLFLRDVSSVTQYGLFHMHLCRYFLHQFALYSDFISFLFEPPTFQFGFCIQLSPVLWRRETGLSRTSADTVHFPITKPSRL
jgi:hypothetical protein